MERINFYVSLYVAIIFAFVVVGCRDHQQKIDGELFKHSKPPHPDEDTSEFGRIYAEARKRPDNSYGHVLLELGETNLKLLKNDEKYRIVKGSGINSIPQEIVSVFKKDKEIKLTVYKLYFHEGDFRFRENEFSIDQNEHLKFVSMIDNLDLDNFESKISTMQIASSLHPSSCYVEGVRNGEYFHAGEVLLEGNTLGELCSFWDKYQTKSSNQSRNNRLQVDTEPVRYRGQNQRP